MRLKILIIIIFSTFYIINCSSEQETSREKIELERKYASSNLAFGSAIVSGVILDNFKVKNGNEFVMQVDTVHGYGPSTPPIAVGSKIRLFQEDVSSENEKLDLEKTTSENVVKLQIRFIQSPNSSDRLWKILIQYH